MTTNLPDSLRPTSADLARDAALAREAEAILGEVRKRTGMGVKINTEGYNAVTFGPDGKPVARVVNGVPQQSEAEEAVARAQAAANADIMRLEKEIARLVAQRDEISAYEPDGTPRFVRNEAARAALDGQARALRLTKVNQQRLNERRWREAAAPAVRSGESSRQLLKELEAQGKITRTRSW